jgi:predicted DNA-binding protein YlxM (UPF0122 family)
MSNYKKLPEDEIIKLYTIEHFSAMDIAKKYGVSNCTISKRLKKYGIVLQTTKQTRNPNSAHKKVFDKDSIQIIIRLYTIDRLSSVEIGKRFNVSFTKIIKVLRENNVPIYDSRGSKKDAKSTIKPHETQGYITNLCHGNGDVTCPSCGKTRTINIKRSIVQYTIKNKGKCNSCICKEHKIILDVDTLKKLYLKDQYTVADIAKQLNVSSHTVAHNLIYNGITVKTKGEAHSIKCKNKIRNKGTIPHPVEGDIRNGKEIGMRNAYFIYARCGKCHKGKWIEPRRYNDKYVCKDCYGDKILDNRGTLEYPIVGDFQRGCDVGKNGTSLYKFVECPDCKGTRWINSQRTGDKPICRCRKCSSRINGLQHRGINSKLWLGGCSLKDYPTEFNPKLKKIIRERDGFICQLCGKKENGVTLVVHHIDYNKKNIHPNNLISLCNPRICGCHMKTNFNRKYWTEYFTNVLKTRGLYITTKNQFILPL